MSRHAFVSLFAVAAAALATAPLPAGAQASKPSTEWDNKTIPIEVFGQFPTMTGPRLSPGGGKVAAKVRAGGVQALAILPIGDPTAKPFIVAKDADFATNEIGERQISSYSWIDDQNLLIGLRSRDNQDGQWFDVTRIAAYNVTTRQITPLAWDGAAGQAGSVLWRSVPGTPKPHLLLQRQSNNYGTEKWFNPEVVDVDVATGKYTVVQRPNPIVRGWGADSAGVVRLGISSDPDTGKKRILYRPDADAPFKTIINDAPGMHDTLEIPEESWRRATRPMRSATRTASVRSTNMISTRWRWATRCSARRDTISTAWR